MSDALSQDEINALLGGDTDGDVVVDRNDQLTAIQKDTLGEIGNISMGTAATTLSTLLNQKVNITTPKVKIMSWREIADAYDRPCVGVKIDYTIGIKGSNVLILKNRDVKIITDLMMGGNGQVGSEDPINDIDLSAIGEAMNQMIGSSSTSLASLINTKIDIATPKAFELDFSDAAFPANLGFNDEDNVAVTVFELKIAELIDSEIMQVLPIEFASELTSSLVNPPTGADAPPPANAPTPRAEVPMPSPEAKVEQPEVEQAASLGAMSAQQQMTPQGGATMEQQQPAAPTYKSMQQPGAFHNATAAPANFQQFDFAAVQQQKENIDILMDVPLEVKVELGKTTKRIKEILEFSPGTIIELDKLAGEPIDILVNNKYVAKGEVVVIDENFGIRVTSIINPELRI